MLDDDPADTLTLVGAAGRAPEASPKLLVVQRLRHDMLACITLSLLSDNLLLIGEARSEGEIGTERSWSSTTLANVPEEQCLDSSGILQSGYVPDIVCRQCSTNAGDGNSATMSKVCSRIFEECDSHDEPSAYSARYCTS